MKTTIEVARRNCTEDRYKRTVVYFWPKGENIMDNLMNRRNRPYDFYRQHLPQVMQQAGLDPKLAATAKWRQKAGCNCGCSPGFIIDFYSRDSIHVDISTEA